MISTKTKTVDWNCEFFINFQFDPKTFFLHNQALLSPIN
jgi:hypothetical protein